MTIHTSCKYTCSTWRNISPLTFEIPTKQQNLEVSKTWLSFRTLLLPWKQNLKVAFLLGFGLLLWEHSLKGAFILGLGMQLSIPFKQQQANCS